MSVWSVDLCRGWQRIGQLQGDAYTFEGVERWLEPGEWSCTFPDSAPTWASLSADGVITQYAPRDVDTIRLVENGAIRFAGAVAPVATGIGGATRSRSPDGIRWTLAGPDLWGITNTRVAYPDPTASTGWTDSYDVNTGAASTVLAAYLSDNLGPTALADRTIPGFGIVDAGVGTTSTWSARFQTLTELAKRICADGSITMRFTVDFAGQVVAMISAPRDLRAVVLSDEDDLVSVTSRYVPAAATYVLAGGQGTLTSRVFRSADSGASGPDRSETFVDQSSLSEADEVQLSADATLAASSSTWSISGEVADAVTERVGFGRTVFVGDRVSVQSEGRRFQVPVTSIAWAISAERQVCRPRLGEAVPDALSGLIRDVAGLAARFDSNVA